MQSIRTKYYAPTNTRGPRIVAKCEAGSISMPYRHDLNIDGNHKAACGLLRKKLGWDSSSYADMVGGFFDGAWYWVFDDKRLSALRGIVNSMRKGTWSGNPWCKPEFKEGVRVIGSAYGFYGDPLQAPTHDHEIESFRTNGVTKP